MTYDDPFSRSRRNCAPSVSSPCTVTAGERETIELLLLRNRGSMDAPEMARFDRSVVTEVFFEIMRLGYLRSLDSIPAMAIYGRSFSRLVFSAAGRIRFYQLERLLAERTSYSRIPDSVGSTSCG